MEDQLDTHLRVSSENGPLRWQMHGHGVSTTAPTSHGHSAVAYKNCLYIYGGDIKDNKRISEIHKHSLVSGTWSIVESKGQKPEARSGQSSVVYNGHMYIFGGRDGRTYYADLYSFCFATRVWTKMDTRGALVKRRYRQTAVVHNRKLYIFGGEFTNDCSNDFYCYDFETSTWTEIHATGNIPDPRSGHSAEMHDGCMYIFGGRNHPTYYADIHKYDFVSNKWSKLSVNGLSPPRTYNHSSFIFRNSLFVFGGYGLTNNINLESGIGSGHRHSELYVFSFETKQWSIAQTRGRKPSARLGHTMTFINGSIYLYGGWDRNGYRSDLHSIHFDDVQMDFRTLLKNPKLADIEFIVENKHIPAHLAMISVRCKKLLDLIQSQIVIFDKNGNFCISHDKLPIKITIDDIKKSVFIHFLEYLYTGTLPYDPTDNVLLRGCAVKFGLQQCCDFATYQIKKNISIENVLSILQAADDCNEKDVKNYSLRFIGKNYDQVASNEAIKTLSQELLVEVLRVPTKHFLKKTKKRRNTFDDIGDIVPPSELKESLMSLVGNPLFADISFLIEDKIIYAHYCVLYSRHPTFTRLWFDSGMKESKTRQVKIENVTYDSWMQLLRYMYCGSIELSSISEALDLIYISDQYLLDSLKNHCENYVTTCINDSNVLKVLTVADSCRLPELKDLCLDLLSNNFSMLVKQESQLSHLSPNLLAQIIVSHSRVCSHKYTELHE